MAIGCVVKRWRERAGWDQSELARRADLSPSTINRIESGERPRPSGETLAAIAGALGITTNDLTGEVDMPIRPVRIFGEVAFVPVVCRSVHAGRDHWADTGESEPVGAELAHHGRLYAAPVSGTCMVPEIEPGDTVIFDQARREPVAGEMVVCTTGDGQVLVKRYAIDVDGQPVLWSHDGQRIRPNGTRVEGVVVRIIRKPERRPMVQ